MPQIVRKTGLDCLKILAILMVIFQHMLGGIESFSTFTHNSPEYWLLWILRCFSKVNVNAFVLISAYFLTQKEFSARHLFLNILEVWLYSILSYIVVAIINGEVQFVQLAKALFPVLSNSYWFATCYIGLYMLSPLLNRFVHALSRRALLFAVFIAYIVCCIYPNFFYLTRDATGGGRTLVWFVVLYFAAAYIRLYVDEKSIKKRLCLICYVGCSTCVFAIKFACDNLAILTGRTTIFESLGMVFFSNDSPIYFIASIALFLWMFTIKFDNNTRLKMLITRLSSHSYAVYLIHDGSLASYIWAAFAAVPFSGVTLALYILMLPLLIYLICSAIDSLRKRAFSCVEQKSIFIRWCKKCDTFVNSGIGRKG